MAKTYLNTIKYEIRAKYEVQGIVEKPDIIGAIFGQSEGMLGEDMDLKELQQAGKLGRIEITVNKGKGVTYGEIIIPSSLDQIKTSILAATVETVEKVGPCDTKITILNISDVRKEKRTQITDRAKQLLQKIQKFESVESEEIATQIRGDVRTKKIVTYNGLIAGPEVEKNKQIIVVEGRADVLKLLSFGINNAVAMNGSNINKELIKLCKEKEVIVLIDGDRGGQMNVKKLASLTNVNFVAKAPDGKEVEELTQKEILQSLKRRVALADYNKVKTTNEYRNNYSGRTNNYNNQRNNFRNNSRYNFGQRNNRQSYGNKFSNDNFRRERYDPFKGNYRRAQNNKDQEPKNEKIENKKQPIKTINQEPKIPKNIEKDFEKIKGKSKARFYDEKNKKIKDIKVKELVESLGKTRKKVKTILFDGIITKRVVEAAEKNNIKTLIGAKKTSAKSKNTTILTM